MKNFKDEFFKLLKLLREGTPFAFATFSEGEVTIVKIKRLVLSERYFIQEDVYGSNAVGAPIPYMEEERKDFDPIRHAFYHRQLVDAYKFQKLKLFQNYIT